MERASNVYENLLAIDSSTNSDGIDDDEEEVGFWGSLSNTVFQLG